MTQQSFVKPFRVRGGRKADLLWRLLYEMGIEDGAEDKRHPQVEFVGSENAVVAPGALVVYLVVEQERNKAFQAVHVHKWAQEALFVDAEGSGFDFNKRLLSRILNNTE